MTHGADLPRAPLGSEQKLADGVQYGTRIPTKTLFVHTHDARWNDSNGSWEMAPRGTGKAEAENVPLQDTHAEADIPWNAELAAKNDEHKLRLDHHAREGNLFLMMAVLFQEKS